VPQNSLDARKSQLSHLHAMPISLPSNDLVSEGPWSRVPLWRGLDSAFLCAPAIPRAPAAPRVKIEMVGRSLRISDECDDELDAGNTSAVQVRPTEKRRSPMNLLVLCASAGFLGGILMAWLFGVFG